MQPGNLPFIDPEKLKQLEAAKKAQQSGEAAKAEKAAQQVPDAAAKQAEQAEIRRKDADLNRVHLRGNSLVVDADAVGTPSRLPGGQIFNHAFTQTINGRKFFVGQDKTKIEAVPGLNARIQGEKKLNEDLFSIQREIIDFRRTNPNASPDEMDAAFERRMNEVMATYEDPALRNQFQQRILQTRLQQYESANRQYAQVQRQGALDSVQNKYKASIDSFAASPEDFERIKSSYLDTARTDMQGAGFSAAEINKTLTRYDRDLEDVAQTYLNDSNPENAYARLQEKKPEFIRKFGHAWFKSQEQSTLKNLRSFDSQVEAVSKKVSEDIAKGRIQDVDEHLKGLPEYHQKRLDGDRLRAVAKQAENYTAAGLLELRAGIDAPETDPLLRRGLQAKLAELEADPYAYAMNEGALDGVQRITMTSPDSWAERKIIADQMAIQFGVEVPVLNGEEARKFAAKLKDATPDQVMNIFRAASSSLDPEDIQTLASQIGSKGSAGALAHALSLTRHEPTLAREIVAAAKSIPTSALSVKTTDYAYASRVMGESAGTAQAAAAAKAYMARTESDDFAEAFDIVTNTHEISRSFLDVANLPNTGLLAALGSVTSKVPLPPGMTAKIAEDQIRSAVSSDESLREHLVMPDGVTPTSPAGTPIDLRTLMDEGDVEFVMSGPNSYSMKVNGKFITYLDPEDNRRRDVIFRFR